MSDNLNNDHDVVQEGATPEVEQAAVATEADTVDYRVKFEEAQEVAKTAQEAADKKEELLVRSQKKLREKDKLIRNNLTREADIRNQLTQFQEGELAQGDLNLEAGADFEETYREHFGFDGAPPEDFLEVAELLGDTPAAIAQYRRDWRKVNPADLLHIQEEVERRRQLNVEQTKDQEIAELREKLAAKATPVVAAVPVIPSEPLSTVVGSSDTSVSKTWVKAAEQDLGQLSDTDFKNYYKDMLSTAQE